MPFAHFDLPLLRSGEPGRVIRIELGVDVEFAYVVNDNGDLLSLTLAQNVV